MGGHSSKDISKSEFTRNTIQEHSTGFHILELHMPTMGFSFAWIFGVSVFSIFLIFLYKMCKSQTSSHQEGLSHNWNGRNFGQSLPFTCSPQFFELPNRQVTTIPILFNNEHERVCVPREYFPRSNDSRISDMGAGSENNSVAHKISQSTNEVQCGINRSILP